jgi:hypothetical protein
LWRPSPPTPTSTTTIARSGPRRDPPGLHHEIVGVHVTSVVDHHSDVIVRAGYDGDYDKTNLPDEWIMSSHHSVRDDKVISLAIIDNQPSPY